MAERAANPSMASARSESGGTRSAGRAAAWEYGGRIGGIVLGVAASAALARSLGPSDFGIFTTALGLVAIGHSSVESGFKQAAIRSVVQSPAETGQITGSYVVVRGGLGIVASLLVGTAVYMLLGADQLLALSPLVVTLALAVISSVGFLLQARLRNDLFTLALLAQSVVWLLLTLLGLSRGWSLGQMALAYLVSSLVQVSVTVGSARRIYPGRLAYSANWARRLGRMAVSFSICGGLVVLAFKVDSVVILRVLGADEAGLYNAAYRVFEQLQTLPYAVAAVLLPLLSGHSRGRDGAGQAVGLTKLAVAATVVLALPVLFFGAPVLRFIYGSAYATAAPVLMVLAVTLPIATLRVLWTSVVFASEKLLALTLVLTVASVANIVANLLLLQFIGIVGAAIVTLATEILIAVGMKLAYSTMLPVLSAAFWLRLAIATTLAGVISLALTGLPWVVGLVAATVVTAAIVYVVCLRATNWQSLFRRDRVDYD